MREEKIQFTFQAGFISGFEPFYLGRGHGDWLAEDGEGVWHVWLQERVQRLPREVKARPVTKRGELHGWEWRMELDYTHLHFPVRRIAGQRPSLPMQGTQETREVKFYRTVYPSQGLGSACYPRAEHYFSRLMTIERLVSGLLEK